MVGSWRKKGVKRIERWWVEVRTFPNFSFMAFAFCGGGFLGGGVGGYG